ncbi:MAG: AtpZ/AtpI family protein [Planctomycetaceae bacterium]|nr:AtpZ/AtpI family protein [Planctomycetaceae bacterium]
MSKTPPSPPPVPAPSGGPETPPLLEALRMLSHITTAISLILICGGLGYGLDYLLQWTLFSLIGVAGGSYLAIRHLIQVTSN